ncbi:MAG: transposase [Oscillospiraceae bacterium]
MPEEYVTLEEAAGFESLKYNTVIQRLQRNPQIFKTQTQPRECGGKDMVLVAVSSLSAKGRRAYKASRRIFGSDVIIDENAADEPWYLDVNLNSYIESNKQKYYESIELVNMVQRFIAYPTAQKTDYAQQFAMELGVSQRTLYRYTENVIQASAWALKLEKEDGMSREYFRALSLCRKPKDSGSFPSLTDEQRAVIENIWFDKDFSANRGTMEALYSKFEELAVKRQWSDYPSAKTVSRYIKAAMETKGAVSARYLAAKGTIEWKNKQMLKGKRDTTALKVMEYVMADAHTLDFWVQYTMPNGKIKAVRPVLVAWIDVRSRCIMGDVFCVNSNAQVVKESVVKMAYSRCGGIPSFMHMDNGKDFTANEMLGQNRKIRGMKDIEMDSETRGFLISIGVNEWTRALPFQPWDKGQIERSFSTFCTQFSKQFKSYTGTLTGSKTEGKIKKDIPKMLERGELLTMDEAFEKWTDYKENVYHKHVHRGLKDAGEKWVTPIDLFENAARYEKAVPPREYAAMLLMKADRALVKNQGITKFGTLYTDFELCHYIGKAVGIKWDIDDITKLYVYDESGKKICEAVSAELLQFAPHCSQEMIEEHKRKQNKQLAQTRQLLKEMETPYEVRVAEGRAPDVVGKLDLMIGHAPKSKTISLPQDKEFRAEMATTNKKKAKASGEFFDEKADSALSRIKAINA